MKLLNETQKRQLQELLDFYNFYYICNMCGSVYGADKKETYKTCPKCELVIGKKKSILDGRKDRIKLP